MATEKRLIDPDELHHMIEILYQKHYVKSYDKTVHDIFNAVRRRINRCSTVEAVELDKFNVKLHHVLIDNEGVPEVKLQIGDRYFILHTDPVDVREVVHGRWEPREDVKGFVRCSVCHDCNIYDEWPDGKKWNYCPNCGAKMDGDANEKM